MLPGPVRTASAFALLAVLGYAIFKPRVAHGPRLAHEHRENTSTLSITGMTCSHCTESVRRALLECPGVGSAEVNLKTGKATVEGGAFDFQSLRRAVEQLGYTVKQTEGGAQQGPAKDA